MKKTIIVVMLSLLGASAHAGSTYTPSELNRMVNNGQYPAQGQVNNSQTESMSFSECIDTVENVMSQLRGLYPVEQIVKTEILYIVKAWANDGVITANCSGPDKKLILTQASYK